MSAEKYTVGQIREALRAVRGGGVGEARIENLPPNVREAIDAESDMLRDPLASAVFMAGLGCGWAARERLYEAEQLEALHAKD